MNHSSHSDAMRSWPRLLPLATTVASLSLRSVQRAGLSCIVLGILSASQATVIALAAAAWA